MINYNEKQKEILKIHKIKQKEINLMKEAIKELIRIKN